MRRHTLLKSTLCLLMAWVCNVAWAALGNTKTGTPENGKKYYIYADTYYGGQYVNRYLYNDNGTLKMSENVDETSNNFVWTCTVSNGKHTFQNVGNPAKYLSHKAVADAAYNFTLGKTNATHEGTTIWSDAADRYLVAKNDGTKFDQSTTTYNQATGDWCTDYVFVEYVAPTGYTLKVTTNYAGAGTLMVNGESATLPYTKQENLLKLPVTLTATANNPYKFVGFYKGGELVGTTVTVSELTDNITYEARYELGIFSADLNNLVPVRVNNSNNKGYAIKMNAADSYAGKAVNSGNTDSYDENEIWYLVGNASSFKMYNKVAGTTLALKLEGTGENSAATLATDGTSLCLEAQADGSYGICPAANKQQSLNMHGGAGQDIKLYRLSDANSKWYLKRIDVDNTLQLNVEVNKVWASSPRVAELSFTINGETGQTRVLGDTEGKKLYLPEGATFSASSMTYRGYTFNGFGNGVDNYANQTIPEGGMELTASYTANNERTLYYSPRDGRPYRIPAIATAPNGDIFAICDYRPCGNDIGYGEVDLVCRVSSDNGVTWTEERTIADGKGPNIVNGDTTKIWQVGYGDPAIVADRESNKVLVMSVCGNRTCWDGNYGDPNPNPNRVSRLYITYDEEKQEWVYGEPEEVTYSIYPLFNNKNGGEAHAASLFIGAGKICQSRVVKKGDYYRLYCAVWVVTKSIRTHHNYVLYSDDFGQTWNVLGGVGNDSNPSQPGPAYGGNEPKCEELPDGTVVLSSRKNYGRYFNLFTFKDKTYTTGTWGTVCSSNDVSNGLSFGGNSTNGEIYKVRVIRKADEVECDIMFQSIPTGNDRSNVAIYYKEMEYKADGTNKYTPTTFAQGWTKGKHVSTKGSCYSTMIGQADGRIAFFFEEEPSGYCMVYIPYTIEELTEGKYYSVMGENASVELSTLNPQPSTEIYDLMGRRVEHTTKGIYIINGRKIVIK